MDLKQQYKELLDLRKKVAQAEYNLACDAVVSFTLGDTTYLPNNQIKPWGVPSWLQDNRMPTIPLFMDEFSMAPAKSKRQIAEAFLLAEKDRQRMIDRLKLANMEAQIKKNKRKRKNALRKGGF